MVGTSGKACGDRNRPPCLAITALLCAGAVFAGCQSSAVFAGRQSSGSGGAGPPQKQPQKPPQKPPQKQRPPLQRTTAKPNLWLRNHTAWRQPPCDDVASDASCRRWFNTGSAPYPPPRLHAHLEDGLVFKEPRQEIRREFRTLVLLATCAAPNAYNLAVTLMNLRLLRQHVARPLIVATACRPPANEVLLQLDAVLLAPCAAARGYDSGLWQQAVRWALSVGLWAHASEAILINDSVLGPLSPITVPTGVSFGAVWASHIGSSSVSMYSNGVMHSHAFVDFWNRTHFYCAKYGSMQTLEGQLAQRYLRAGFQCSTYTNNINELSQPTLTPRRLPFYKHKNRPHDLHSLYAANGMLPDPASLTIGRRPVLEPCAISNNSVARHRSRQ